MSEDTTNTEINNQEDTSAQEPLMDRRTTLRNRCKQLGIRIQGQPSEETMSALIKDKLEGTANAAQTNEAGSPEPTDGETTAQRHRRLRKEATKLVRVNITCMNPSKSDITGEFFSVGNKVIGTIKKFIPYTPYPDGYHIPYALYQALKNRKFQMWSKRKKSDGTEVNEAKLVNEFAIEVLPQLTPKELERLRVAQAAKGMAD